MKKARPCSIESEEPDLGAAAKVGKALKPKVGDSSKPAAAFLLGALTLLGTLLGLLQITNETVVNLARDQGRLTAGAFAFAVAALIAGALGAWVFAAGSTGERRAFSVGIILLGVGLLLGVIGSVRYWGQHSQPSITASPTVDGSAVDVAVRGRGLRSSDHLVVSVEQLLRTRRPGGGYSYVPGLPLYGASLGPNAAGEVDQKITVKLPPGDFDDLQARVWVGEQPADCYRRGNTTGCVTVHVARRAERPQLRLTWGPKERASRTLRINLSAQNIPGRAIYLLVTGTASQGRPRSLAEWALAPNARGDFQQSLSVLIPKRFLSVCVAASTQAKNPTCSPNRGMGKVWARLAVTAG